MNINQLQLSDTALSKLSHLAMAVEIHCKKRFLIRGNVDHVVSLLNLAGSSQHDTISQRFADFIENLSEDSIGFFRTLGVDLATRMSATKAPARTMYRGQAIEEKTSMTSKDEPKKDEKKKKKIIYRGTVTYV